ncbi:HtaA domain-containing protein [Leifsonia sp. AG29]|uniref:HtaA domain-containing protein n=1 Tax=Leifsonia sp. AG29 TaxID=2598860 RepID=UPI00131C7723|nr:HtaA domain-containing protein [Leifsonia sp. AG29]
MTEPQPPLHALAWGVKHSFLVYVAAVGGNVVTDGGAEASAEEFRFPFVGEGAPGEYRFAGRIRFRAHDGLLDVTIRDPWVRKTPVSTQVSVSDGSQRFVVAVGPAFSGQELSAVPLQLSERGTGLFHNTYPAFTDMDSVRFIRPSHDSRGGTHTRFPRPSVIEKDEVLS